MYDDVIRILKESYGKGSMLASLSGKDPFQVLIATALSARAKDEITIKVADKLFNRFKTPEALSEAPIGILERIIRPIGFYRIKALRVKEISADILERFGGRVPDDMDSLLSIKGVGRKTAGCVLVYAYKKMAIPVDTHVHQIANRLGWVRTRRPEDTEKRLMELIQKDLWMDVNEAFVLHGKRICTPVSPRCSICIISRFCKGRGVKKSR